MIGYGSAFAAAFLLAGVGAYWTLLSPWSPLFGPERPVTEPEMREALREFTTLSRDPDAPGAAWGVEGTMADTPYGTYDLRIVWDRPNAASEIRVEAGNMALHAEASRAQRGTIVNYVTDAGTFLARDEDPSTLLDPRSERFGTATLGPEADQFSVDRTASEILERRRVTHFIGGNATAQIEVWVYQDTRKLAGFWVQDEEGTQEFRVLWGSRASVEVATEHLDRVSFRLGGAVEAMAETDGRIRRDFTVTDAHVEEPRTNEVEMRLVDRGEAGNVVASMRLDAARASSQPYELAFRDVDGDGLLSAGDQYSASFPASEPGLVVELYDLWADRYEGGPLPFVDLWGTAAALALAVGFLRKRGPA